MTKRHMLQIALDGMTDMSRRRYDVNGFLHVDGCHVVKEMVYPHRGDELPEVFGVEPDGIYYAYLPAAVIERACKTFEGLPLLIDHHDESAEAPAKEHRVGSTGTDARFNPPYLDISLHITDQEAIDAIESGDHKELSIGFFANYTPSPGIFNGEMYDFVMSDLIGNHIALVEEGRAGHDCVVADSMPTRQGFAHWMKIHDLVKFLSRTI